VSSGAAFDAKEEVKRATDIVELVGQYLRLQRAGRGYKALCPWHDDSRPSLQINPDRQSFKCWVCDVGGDVFQFVMKMDGISFPEALKLLADKAGIPLQRNSRPANQITGDAEDKQTLYRAMAWAEQQYHQCLLHAPEAEPARRYLAQRRIDPDSIGRFRLGFAPDAWDWLLNRARGASLSPRVLETVGLVAARQNGPGYYDRFRSRVLFPIRDPQGRSVALGGRVLPGPAANETAKYINSPETPLFSKNRMLYGLDVARAALLKSRAALVMEGYTDCLIAQQCGFSNAVAVLGTALGERHIRLLRGTVDRIYLTLDGDEAGMRRTNEVLELFVAEQIDLRIVTLPDDLDPADFLLERGAAAFQHYLDNAVDALEHKFQTATRGHADQGTHAADEAVEFVLATIAKAPRTRLGTTNLREDHILQRLAHRFGISDERLRARLRDLRQPSRRSPAGPPGPSPASLTEEQRYLAQAERWLLEVLLQAPELLPQARARLTIEQLPTPAMRRIFACLCELADLGVEPTFDRLMLRFDEPELQNLLVGLDEDGRMKQRADLAGELCNLLDAFERHEAERRARSEIAALRDHRVDADQELAVLRNALASKRQQNKGLKDGG